MWINDISIGWMQAGRLETTPDDQFGEDPYGQTTVFRVVRICCGAHNSNYKTGINADIYVSYVLTIAYLYGMEYDIKVKKHPGGRYAQKENPLPQRG
ncbi:hypothetical protein DEALK_02760 [Dehalogenimonas alkenigignens]|uniref:Uncharacterized protein n=1 Tax=Dehalogenimonas alkenigignens TaxID=1217799 RepID=A0A0W0GFV5_9CHLR|nr:hypothetical protein DEALK_02760 [Dehalogenimonas alkenigignens]